MFQAAASPSTSSTPPQNTPNDSEGFDTATQITALAHWLRHQPSPASPSAARAFALARSICLLPVPLNAASFSAMPCSSPSGAPLAAPALGWLPRLLPVSGRIVGFRGAGRRVASTSSLYERMYYYCCVVVAGLWRRSTPFQKLRQTQRQRLLPVPVAAGLISSPGSRCSPAL
jgi:hypothetical protein